MVNLKFSHISDCHLGGWRNPELNELGLKSFEKSIDESIEEEVDFVLCSGDLFDTSRPPIDVLERTVEKLKELNQEEIEFYAIEGSHDFSPTDKTMLRVLESAGLLKRVAKISSSDSGLRLEFTIDERTGAKITGIVGKQRTVEKSFYKDLDREWLEDEEGFKIFMFHSAITEFRPEIFQYMESIPLSLFPKEFDYYAGGHVHKPDVFNEEEYGTIGFPGFTFPNDFRELEIFGKGNYFLVEGGEKNLEVNRKKISIADVISTTINANGVTPSELEDKIENKVLEEDIKDKIVLFRVEGTLSSGKIADINFNSLSKKFRDEGARIVKRNTNKLSTKEYEDVKVESSSRSEIEERLIDEKVDDYSLPDVPKKDRKELTRELMNSLDSEKAEGETNTDYRNRIIEEAIQSLEIEDVMEGE